MLALLSLPYVSRNRRLKLAQSWDSRKPEMHVYRTFDWYARHDRNLLLVARLVVLTSPIVLTQRGVGMEWIIAFVVVSMFIVEWLDRVRSEKELERAMQEGMKEYYREVEKPRTNARKRELRQQIDWSGKQVDTEQ